MKHDQLIDLTRRACKLARDKTTDLAPAEHKVDAREYTSVERHNHDRAMLLASPQLVGYVSELPGPGAYCTKTVMGRSILLTRTSDGSVRAFDNVCLHRQSQVATGGAVPRSGSPVPITHGRTTTPGSWSGCPAARDSRTRRSLARRSRAQRVAAKGT